MTERRMMSLNTMSAALAIANMDRGSDVGHLSEARNLMARGKKLGLDFKMLDKEYGTGNDGAITLTDTVKMLDVIEKKFKAKEPVFREATQFRERTASAWMKPDGTTPTWFSEIVAHPSYREYTKKSGFMNLDTHSTLMAWVVMRLRDVSSTSNWFCPSEGLTYKLTATDLVGATCGDLKLPMEAFYIELPPKFMYLEDPKTGWHEVRVLTVTKGEITNKTLEIARKYDADAANVTDSLLGPRLLVECYAGPNDNSRDPFDDSWLFMTYKVLEDDANIDKVLNASMELSKVEELQQGRIGERIFSAREVRIFLLKFVLNFCVYLGSEKATKKHQHAEEITRLEAGKKRKNLRKNVQERIKRLEEDRIFLVGTDVEIDLEMKEIIQTEGTASYKLTYRTLVRGHWRNQAHGPGWKLRTRKWIEPHVRGQELPTKTVGHNYKME